MRWICLEPPDKLKADEQVLLKQLLATDSVLARGYELLQRFRVLLKDRNVVALEAWLCDAGETHPQLREPGQRHQGRLGRSQSRHYLLPWSNGQLEGQVNRVKAESKRKGYGRHEVSDLLRQRVLMGVTETVNQDRARPALTTRRKNVMTRGVSVGRLPSHKVRRNQY